MGHMTLQVSRQHTQSDENGSYDTSGSADDIHKVMRMGHMTLQVKWVQNLYLYHVILYKVTQITTCGNIALNSTKKEGGGRKRIKTAVIFIHVYKYEYNK